MLRDDDHGDMVTADARAATTAKIAAIVVLVPDDEQDRPVNEGEVIIAATVYWRKASPAACASLIGTQKC